MDKDEIIEVEAEEMSDDEAIMAQFYAGKGMMPSIKLKSINRKNITWEEVEQLYNQIENDEEENQ